MVGGCVCVGRAGTGFWLVPGVLGVEGVADEVGTFGEGKTGGGTTFPGGEGGELEDAGVASACEHGDPCRGRRVAEPGSRPCAREGTESTLPGAPPPVKGLCCRYRPWNVIHDGSDPFRNVEGNPATDMGSSFFGQPVLSLCIMSLTPRMSCVKIFNGSVAFVFRCMFGAVMGMAFVETVGRD